MAASSHAPNAANALTNVHPAVRGSKKPQTVIAPKTRRNGSASIWNLTFEVSRPRRAQPGAGRLDRRVGALFFHGPLIARRLEGAVGWHT